MFSYTSSYYRNIFRVQIIIALYLFIYLFIYLLNGYIYTRVRTGFLAHQIAWWPVNIYSIQTGRINRQIFRPCENVNKTFTAHKCRKTNLTGNSAYLTRMSNCFLTKMTAQTKIPVLTEPKRTKSAAREKGFNNLLMVRSKKTHTKNTQHTRPSQA